MRSTNVTESDRCDPPKPRLRTLCPGKACARFVQSRMLELPTNRTAFWGGGLVLSAVSKARISFSYRASGGCFFSAAGWASRERFRTGQIIRATQALEQRIRARISRYCKATRTTSKALFGPELRRLHKAADASPSPLPNGRGPALILPHKSGSRFSIPTGLYPQAQGCEPRATLGGLPEACSTLKGLYRGAGSWRASVGRGGRCNPFRVGGSLLATHPGELAARNPGLRSEERRPRGRGRG